MATKTSNSRRGLDVTGIVASCLLQPVAFARTVPASAGRPVNASDFACFAMGSSMMTNVCTTAKRFELPLVVDNAGNKTVTISARGASNSSNVCCRAVGGSRDGLTFYASNLNVDQCLPSFGAARLITMTGAYVPDWGYLWASCEVRPGGTIITAGYNG